MHTQEIVHALVIIVADKEPMAEYLGMVAKKETIKTHSKVTNSGIGSIIPIQESAPQILGIIVAVAEDMVVVVVARAAKVMVET